MFKSIIIDDSQEAIYKLTSIIEKEFPDDINIIDTCSSGLAGVDSIKIHQPDLVFLDIEMPDKDGFQVLNSLDEIDFAFIFTTAYSEYAVRAFKTSAIDYLLKPIESAELKTALRRINDEKCRHSGKKRLAVLEENSRNAESLDNKRVIFNGTTKKELAFIYMKDILYCEVCSNFCHIYKSDETRILVSHTLKELSEKLNGHHFYRIHESYIINKNYMEKFKKVGSKGIISMSNGKQLEVTRGKRDGFLAWLDISQ